MNSTLLDLISPDCLFTWRMLLFPFYRWLSKSSRNKGESLELLAVADTIGTGMTVNEQINERDEQRIRKREAERGGERKGVISPE